MKNPINKILNIISLLIVLAGLWYVYTLRSDNDALTRQNELKQATIDSIKAVELKPPDTTIIDTTIISVRPIHFSSDFDSLPSPDEYNLYQDSIVNDSIRVWADIKADKLYQIDWTYEPVIRERFTTIEKTRPVIVPEYIDREVKQSGVFATGGLGFGNNFTGSAGLIYLTDKGYFFGGDVIQSGPVTAFGVRVGVKVW